MAYYRFSPTGLTVAVVADRIRVLYEHCRAWNVNITAFKMTATVAWILTNVDIPTVRQNNMAAECGFTTTRGTSEPTTA
jgi:hypothetical protein